MRRIDELVEVEMELVRPTEYGNEYLKAYSCKDLEDSDLFSTEEMIAIRGKEIEVELFNPKEGIWEKKALITESELYNVLELLK